MEEVFLQTHENSRKVSAKRLIKKHLNHEQLQRGFVATDMDGTMFKNDIGVLVFLESLTQSSFWKIPAREFKNLLLPDKYRKLLIAEAGKIPPVLDPENCKRLLQLQEDILRLYEAHRKLPKNATLENPIVNEFARKMIEFDRLIVSMDAYLSTHFKGHLLMRTRFFAGKQRKVLSEMTMRTFRERDNDEQAIKLSTHLENRENVRQMVALNPLEIDQTIVVRKKVRDLLHTFLSNYGIPVTIITTNLQRIARIAVSQSEYRFLKKARLSEDEPLILITGSELTIRFVEKKKKARKRKRGKRLRYLEPNFYAPPPLGNGKSKIAEQIQQTHDRVCLVAIGDSFIGDGAMGLLALENGGVFIAAGDKYDDTRAKFEPLCREAIQKGVKDAANKIWYAISE